MTQILNGKNLAESLLETKLVPRVQALAKKEIVPGLAVILVGDHAASASYVRNKERLAAKAGLKSVVVRREADIPEGELLKEIEKLNQDPEIHGIIVQLPLPNHIASQKVIEAISPSKDVDGFHPVNVGRLLLGQKTLQCCTPKGIMTLLRENNIPLEGKNVVVLGRSSIVGKPIAALLTNANATVTICHSRTQNTAEIAQRADILIVAIGRPRFVTKKHIKPGAVVIDVGIHRTEDGKLCGDVDFDDVSDTVAAITPVPRGIGPMTVYSLIENTIEVAETSLKGLTQ